MIFDALNVLHSQTIKEREVYYFCSDKISSELPHYFICIKNEDDIVIFTCGTTQWEKRQDYLTRRNKSLSTLVYINPNGAGVDFKKETYVDCNSYQVYTIEEFTNVCKSDEFEYKGTLDENYYVQIIQGLHDSDEIDEEFKESLPNPNDI